MFITRLTLKNWRNFREVDIQLGHRGFLIGANASGKSNLLDVFRFLRTIAQSDGGGLQKAVKERGGMTKLRSLHARRDPEVRLEVELSDSHKDASERWRYVLAFKGEGKGQPRVLITEESVHHNGKELLMRPLPDDLGDSARLTQTHLEQINNNGSFRALADHFASTIYLHLVPQLLKHVDALGGRIMGHDPFGQRLLERVAETPSKSRTARLKRIQSALSAAVPQFSELEFEQDPVTGSPHLKANFKHWRVHGSWQREDQFSDGTLRLLGLLWALQEPGDGLLLLEEPELSLNDAITDRIPLMIDRVLGKKNRLRQVLISTHSDNLIAEVDPQTILLLQPGPNGSTVRSPDAGECMSMEHGLNPAEVMLPKTRPESLDQLGLLQLKRLRWSARTPCVVHLGSA